MIYILLIFVVIFCFFMYYFFVQKINALRKQNIGLIIQNKQLKIKINKTMQELKNVRSNSFKEGDFKNGQ